MGNPYKELRRENDNLMEDLSIATWKKLKKIFSSIDTKNVNLYDVETIKNRIICMALEAEKRGEAFDPIAAKELYNTLSRNMNQLQTKERVLYALYRILTRCMPSVAYLIVLWIMLDAIYPSHVREYMGSGFTLKISWASLAVILLWFICEKYLDVYSARIVAVDKGVQHYIPTILKIVAGCACVAAVVILEFRDLPGVHIFWPAFAGGVIVLYIIVKILFDRHIKSAAEKSKDEEGE